MTTRLVSANTRAASRSIVVLPTAGRPSSRTARAGFDEVLDDRDRAKDGPTDAARQPDDLAHPIADRGNPVQRARDAGAVVRIEFADAVHDPVDVFPGDLAVAQDDFSIGIARRRHSPQVQNDLEQVIAPVHCVHRRPDVGKNLHQGIQVIDDGLC